ncbi:GTP-binding and nucleic acid-binding protein YchF [Mycoplasma haemofelis Ohio2]|uniref:GTP-binding and nucleic acid-binding protein YchF n=1 Tax=Mycoplasma haemofelis (strain Ohio2) TaxID=859194 RepID=F6FHR6_MYCHI|nr:GTP-binding and nucleic acid-binding protein YchF [Mycoplasma haemofelis Ohio2]
MSLTMGIVGLPNVGKSSLFNALTNGNALVENRPFATIEPNLGIVKLLDPRIVKLSEIVNPERTVYSTVKFLDIAGLVKGASHGEGLGNKFLENIRSVDAICLVVRAFEDSSVLSVNSVVDPVFEAEIVLCELVYADLDMVDNILRKLKSNDPKQDVLKRMKAHLSDNKLLKNFPLTPDEKEELKIYSFLTSKSIIILANTDDSKESEIYLEKIRSYSQSIESSFLSLNIKLENEVNALSEEDRAEFFAMTNRTQSGLDELISKAFKVLNLKTFFTVGKKEVRSWTFRNGSYAPQCAGIIHSDMERGFIKAKIIKYDDFLEFKDQKILKQEGKVSLEGKKYLMEDGDIVEFEFNI